MQHCLLQDAAMWAHMPHTLLWMVWCGNQECKQHDQECKQHDATIAKPQMQQRP
jgi:hypothetical protein